MNYEKTYTTRYQYRRMGLVPYKATAKNTSKETTVLQSIVFYTFIVFLLLSPMVI